MNTVAHRRFAFLPLFLAGRADPLPLYILKTWLLVFLPSVVISGAIGLGAGALGFEPQVPDLPTVTPFDFFALVVLAPVLETLIMLVPLLLMNRLFGGTAAVLLSATGWAIAHSLHAPMWGFVIWWPFLVFSALILIWRDRGLWVAAGIVMLVHGLQNGAASLLILAGL